MRKFLLMLAIPILMSAGCGFGAEANFTDGRSEDSCDGTFPVCQTTAGCVLGSSEYLKGRFPGRNLFIVSSPANATLTVSILFRSQIATGVDTTIDWFEPGCFERYPFSITGSDLFRAIGNDQVFSQSQQVFEEGEHLIEVFSDSVADFLLKVEVDVGSVP